VSNAALRAVWRSRPYLAAAAPLRSLVSAVAVFVLAAVTAFLEAWTIAGFPHYVIRDRTYMYTVGSVMYGLYFVVAFPAFFRLDETLGAPAWTLGATASDALAASMLVTLLLDFWRITVGGIDGSTLCMHGRAHTHTRARASQCERGVCVGEGANERAGAPAE
jgi:cycloeucalenol cycloisomerase